MRASRFLRLLVAMSVAISSLAFAAPAVVLVTGEHGGAHQETLDALRGALAAELPPGDLAIQDAAQLDAAVLGGARIIVTIGAQAARAVGPRPGKQAVLNTLLTRETWESLQESRPEQRASAIFLDQPVRRQIALVSVALPELPSLVMLASPASEGLSRRLASAARERQLRVNVELVGSGEEIFPALERLLAEPAVLLALPDNTVFNSYTLRNVLLTSYRRRSPLIGFSPAYVRAGALLALYSTPAQIAGQAAEAVRGILAGSGLPPPQAPREFEVAANQNVARSLGIRLEREETIVARVRAREGRHEARP